MRVVRSLADFKRAFPGAASVAVTIGNFDSVHRGHQRLFEVAAQHGAIRGAVTFEPHPKVALAGVKKLDLRAAPHLWPVTPFATKLSLLAQQPLDFVYPIRFTERFSHLSPEEFLSHYIVAGLGASAVVVGHDWAFGRGRAGDSTFLTDAGRRHGFSVIIVPPVIEGGERVSTTRVKEALSVGDTEKLTLFLGRHYTVIGRVCRGEGRGRQIGVPTANLATRLQLLPKNGVYVTRARIGGEVFGAVTNIGTRPTFSGVGRTVETHLLDGGPHSLYGAKLELQFIGRIRDEERFATVDDLIAQIKRDCAVAQERLRSK